MKGFRSFDSCNHFETIIPESTVKAQQQASADGLNLLVAKGVLSKSPVFYFLFEFVVD